MLYEVITGEWVPTFPNARYLLARREFEYWDAAEADALNDGVMADSVRPVVEAGLVDLVDWEHQVCEEVGLTATPGHTPGHVSVRIRSRGDEAVITGDLMHHPVQCAHTDWRSSADVDPEGARITSYNVCYTKLLRASTTVPPSRRSRRRWRRSSGSACR